MYEQRPWLKYYSNIPTTIDFPRISLYEALMNSISQHTDYIAWDFFGKTQTYAEFSQVIQHCADGLAELGLEAGDRITIAMPTCPQSIISLYAVNCLGAVANIIHPLASADEIEYYLNISQSRIAITLDIFFPKFNAIHKQTHLKKLILTRTSDYLPISWKVKFSLSKSRKQPQIPIEKWVVKWSTLFDPNHPRCIPVPTNTDALAAILYSGGTTSTPKAVMLSNRNLIAAGMNVSLWGGFCQKDTIFAVSPLFHSFGLGACAIATFLSGAKNILTPQFSPKMIAHLIRTKKPNMIIGIPSLFQALIQDSKFQKTDLRCLKTALCGMDRLPKIVKKRFKEIVLKSGGIIRIQESYGLTEAVSAVIGNPSEGYREGSIGIPFPNIIAKIVRPGTDEDIGYSGQGELCLHGPTVMLGYLGQTEKTAGILKKHRDGKTWLHTEDLCSMDEDGFFYFHLRLKHIIKSSGITISPIQLEDRLMRHPDVLETCVIGIPDLSVIEKIKAFVVLKEAQKASSDMMQILSEYCRKEIVKECCPVEIEFRPEIPKTLLGKIAYHELVEQETQKLRNTRQNIGESPHWRH
jgi:long-chain acyl-CoA synthetase